MQCYIMEAPGRKSAAENWSTIGLYNVLSPLGNMKSQTYACLLPNKPFRTYLNETVIKMKINGKGPLWFEILFQLAV